MWRFSAADERRYDSLMGFKPVGNSGFARVATTRRRYLLSAASRYCKWRDGDDPRRGGVTKTEAERIERAMIRDLVEDKRRHSDFSSNSGRAVSRSLGQASERS